MANTYTPCLGDGQYVNVLPVDDIHPLLAGKQVTTAIHERFGVRKHARLHKLAVLRLNSYDPLICRCKEPGASGAFPRQRAQPGAVVLLGLGRGLYSPWRAQQHTLM